MLSKENTFDFRTIINTMSDEEFHQFLNNSLKASGSRCIRLERELKNGHSSFTMIFGDIDVNTTKETRLYIDYDTKNEML